jgi:hypothetical protein
MGPAFGRSDDKLRDEAIHLPSCRVLDCFAEPVIGRRFAPTSWLAMTVSGVARALRAAGMRRRVRHCEERSDEAIQLALCRVLDCFASLAMTVRVA